MTGCRVWAGGAHSPWDLSCWRSHGPRCSPTSLLTGTLVTSLLSGKESHAMGGDVW